MIKTNSIGTSVRQKDGPARVTGAAKYYADFIFPGMLQTRILRSPYPAATILRIDTSKAEALEGVQLVMTHENYPKAFRNTLYYVGDLVAAVIAEDETIAEEALELIDVTYEKKKFVLSLEDAIEEDSPQVFEGTPNCNDWEFHAILSDRDPETRLFKTKTPAEYNGFGDIEKGFNEADVIVEQKILNTHTVSRQQWNHEVVQQTSMEPDCMFIRIPKACMMKNYAWRKHSVSVLQCSIMYRRSQDQALAVKTHFHSTVTSPLTTC